MTQSHRPGHPALRLIERYADGSLALDDVGVWTIEAHLEQCQLCRRLLAHRVRAGAATPDRAASTALLDQVDRALSGLVRTIPPSAPPRSWLTRTRRWALGLVLPWLAMAGLILLVALVLDLTAPAHPSLVLLLAPVAPLLGVAAAWNRRTDPAWELVLSSPRAGLWLLLHRTLVVLGVVVPAGMAASLLGGESPVVWLLPCLGLVAATLALGSRFGVQRASIGIATLWAAVVLAPALVRNQDPVVLSPSALPVWVLLALAAAALVLVRGAWFAQPQSRQ